MDIKFENGCLTIDGKEVTNIIFKDGSSITVSFDNNLHIENSIADIPNVIGGKNIMMGSVITSGGNFHLGDNS